MIETINMLGAIISGLLLLMQIRKMFHNVEFILKNLIDVVFLLALLIVFSDCIKNLFW